MTLDVPYLILIFLTTLTFSIYKFLTSFFFDPLRHIPGPRGVPILGYLPFMGRHMNLTLTRLWKTYGDVYQLKLGTRSVVVLNGQDTLKRALVEKSIDFAGRPDFYTYKVVSRESLVGVNDYSERFREGKKMLCKAFKNFEMQKKPELQQAAHNSVGQLIEVIKKANNEPFDPNPHMYGIVCTIMGYICWGEHFDKDDGRVKHVIENADEFGKAMAFGVLYDYLPFMKIFIKKKLKKLESLILAKKEYNHKLASEHVSTYNGKEMRDITDFFHKATEDMPEEKKRTLNLEQKDLLSLSGTLFGAGFATITVTTKWAMVLMAKYPEIQTKMQRELDHVVGKERWPFLDDMTNLPYTMAVIYEVDRYSSVAYMGFAHKTLCDTEINGFLLPKGTTVIPNYHSAHRDSKYFTEPDTFDPERFLTPQGQLNQQLVSRVMSYGLGMRRCGGASVAPLQIFTFIATLLHQCHIQESPDHPIKLNNYRATLAINPNPFKVVMRSRFGKW